MKLGSVDAVLTRQALIIGHVQDALTGRPTLNLPTVELFYQTPVGEPSRRYPLTTRLDPHGLFVFAGDPMTAFPQLSPGGTLDLRLTASAPGYQTLNEDFSLSAADLALTEQMRQVDGRDVTIALLAAPLIQRQMALLPQPVHLGGRVVDADDPEEPISNAQVRVTQPAARGPTTTNEDGFFTLHDMPVALEITVRVEHGDFGPLEETITLDYRQPVNQQTFALAPQN